MPAVVFMNPATAPEANTAPFPWAVKRCCRPRTAATATSTEDPRRISRAWASRTRTAHAPANEPATSRGARRTKRGQSTCLWSTANSSTADTEAATLDSVTPATGPRSRDSVGAAIMPTPIPLTRWSVPPTVIAASATTAGSHTREGSMRAVCRSRG